MKTKAKRGGARKGSGRKPLGKVPLKTQVSPATLESLRREAGGHRGIGAVIDRWFSERSN